MLRRALASGRVAHAYLFTGPRGVGKTSIARILAHEINKLPYSEESHHLDIIEIDAASNNGVEDIRDLRDKVQIAPVSAAKKIYIIDEVHMLSKPAFNALLKTLEEPPEHVVFIFATTDVEKLPATIISRTQRFAFRSIGPKDATAHLRTIADKEGIVINDDALALIAQRGDGSFRDSISLLDQLSSLVDDKVEISAEIVANALGLAPKDLINQLLSAVDKHDVARLAELLSKAESDGLSPVVITDQLISTLREAIPEKPQLLHLFDALLDVAKSTQPAMKLLGVLGTAALEAKPKTAALAAPVLEVSATIEELSKQATQPHPKDKPAQPKPFEAKVASVTPKIEQASASQSNAKQPTTTKTNSNPFDWPAVVEYSRTHFVALYSVLSKCGHELIGSSLTIYTINNFYKKKLDDPKYHTHLFECLEGAGSYALEVHTVPTAPPMKSSEAAAIAAIMGGGVEVLPETS